MKNLAVIIIFNPNTATLKRNLYSIIRQVNKILIINNGNDEFNADELIDSDISKVIVINNGRNKGIAAALNQGLNYAYNEGFEWILTLDQDSISPSNIIREYNETLYQFDNVCLVCPYIYDLNRGDDINYLQKFEEVFDETDVITSGSYINVTNAIKIGGFCEKLFIDYVDTEFQKRLLNANYRIIRNNKVVLEHEVGEIIVKRLFYKNIICTNHNPVRRYYQVRNRLYYRKKYYGNRALIKEKVRLIMGTFKILLYEDDKFAKLISTIRGFQDYKNL